MSSEYRMAGKVDIPEDKKQEFNEYVMKILDRCGIRKRKEVNLGEKSVTILEKPKPDQNGIVSFDYSIFEQKKRERSTYNTNTCELYSTDREVSEYGLVMHCILMLQECYSNGSCIFMEDKKPIGNIYYYYMNILRAILNKKIYNGGRGKIWDLLLLLKNTTNADLPLSESDIFSMLGDGYVDGYVPWEDFQMKSTVAAYLMTEPPTGAETSITDRVQIPGSEYWAQAEYLYKIMAGAYQQDENSLEHFLKKLLQMQFADRKVFSEAEDAYGIMAELSLYVPPAGFVSMFALLKKKAFWDVWDDLITGDYYRDGIYKKDRKKELPDKCDPLVSYIAIFRKNADEFLEFWDGENQLMSVLLSAEMKEQIQIWKKLIDRQEDQPELPVESYLSAILADLETEWSCRYIDETFVEKILSNKSSPVWRKVLLVLRKMVDDGIELFPELDRKMAVFWLQTYRTSFDKKAIAAYCSLMENDAARYQIFGF